MSILEQFERDLLEAARLRLPVEQPGNTPVGRAGGRTRRWPGSLVALFGVAVGVGVIVLVVGLGVLHWARSEPGGAPIRSVIRTALPSRRPSRAYVPLARLLSGVPQAGTRLGSRAAPVSIVVFSDLGSPVSRLSAENVLPAVIRGPVRSGEVRLTFRALCTSSCAVGQGVFDRRQRAALAAGRQGLFWNYALLAFSEQARKGSTHATPTYLRSLANQIPAINLSEWQHDRDLPAFGAQLKSDAHAASAAGIFATPVFVISGPGKHSETINGMPTLKQLTRAIQQAR